MVTHAFDLSTRERGRQTSEFEASLIYRVSSRTARAIQRNPVSKQKKKKYNLGKCSFSLYDELFPRDLDSKKGKQFVLKGANYFEDNSICCDLLLYPCFNFLLW
jgi:hypothetical protein